MAGQSSAMFTWSWTEASVSGSQVFGRALMASCECTVSRDFCIVKLNTIYLYSNIELCTLVICLQ